MSILCKLQPLILTASQFFDMTIPDTTWLMCSIDIYGNIGYSGQRDLMFFERYVSKDDVGEPRL